MKTKLISTLKKEMLIIELPEGTDMKDPIQILKNKGNHLVYSKHNGHIISRNKFPDGEWTLLGSPDEIKEEDARELFDELECENQWCENGKIPQSYGAFSVCDVCDDIYLESFNSALESEIYWDVNPLGEEEPEIIEGLGSGTLDLAYENKQWHEAQEKTFDRNRTLIFVKN